MSERFFAPPKRQQGKRTATDFLPSSDLFGPSAERNSCGTTARGIRIAVALLMPNGSYERRHHDPHGGSNRASLSPRVGGCGGGNHRGVSTGMKTKLLRLLKTDVYESVYPAIWLAIIIALIVLALLA